MIKKLMRKKITKKKAKSRTHLKIVVIEEDTIDHLIGYLEAWRGKLSHFSVDQVKKNKFSGRAKIKSNTVT